MKTFLLLATIVVVVLSLIVGVGVAIGFVLHWLLPAIDFGIGVLIGVVALAFTAQMVTWLMAALAEVEVEGEEATEERLSDVVYVAGEMRGRSKRKRKRNR